MKSDRYLGVILAFIAMLIICFAISILIVPHRAHADGVERTCYGTIALKYCRAFDSDTGKMDLYHIVPRDMVIHIVAYKTVDGRLLIQARHNKRWYRLSEMRKTVR